MKQRGAVRVAMVNSELRVFTQICEHVAIHVHIDVDRVIGFPVQYPSEIKGHVPY